MLSSTSPSAVAIKEEAIPEAEVEARGIPCQSGFCLNYTLKGVIWEGRLEGWVVLIVSIILGSALTYCLFLISKIIEARRVLKVLFVVLTDPCVCGW